LQRFNKNQLIIQPLHITPIRKDSYNNLLEWGHCFGSCFARVILRFLA
jgi:hypothetical protein